MPNTPLYPLTVDDIRTELSKPAAAPVFKPPVGELVRLVHLRYDEMPPTSNHIYIRGTILSTEARSYAERFSQWMIQHYGHAIQRMNKEGLFAVHLRFFFETLVNKNWGEHVAPSKRAESRYKRVDLSNRVKLLEDCVRDALGIDDSHTFAMSLEKHHAPQDPHVEITVQEVDPELFGL